MLTDDEWIENPFSGERYALMHQIAVWLINAQIESAEKSATKFGRPLGPYGETYVRLSLISVIPPPAARHARDSILEVEAHLALLER